MLGKRLSNRWFNALYDQAEADFDSSDIEDRDYGPPEWPSAEQVALDRKVEQLWQDRIDEDPIDRCELFIRRARALAAVIAGATAAELVTLGRLAAQWGDDHEDPHWSPVELLVDPVVVAPAAPPIGRVTTAA